MMRWKELLDLIDGRVLMTFFACILILLVLSIPCAYAVGLSYGRGYFKKKLEYFNELIEVTGGNPNVGDEDDIAELADSHRQVQREKDRRHNAKADF